MRSVYRWAGASTAIIVVLCATALPGTGVNGSITVTVRSGDGNDTPVADAQISIVGTTFGATTTALGKAHLANVPAGVQTIMVRRIGYCTTKRTVNVPAGGEIATTVWTCADAVSIDNPDEQVVVLADARVPDPAGSHCENDLLHVGHGGVAVPENALALSSGGTSCPGSVSVFSEGRALSFMNNAAALPWTDAVGDVYDVARPPRLLRVPITFWMTGAMNKTDVSETILTVHLAIANNLLRNSMTGLELVADETTGGLPTVNDADAIPGAAAAIGTGCDHVRAIEAMSAIYDPTRLNVYYVNGGTANGYTCGATGGLNVIFLYWGVGQPLPSTLAHEIGHALGLDRPDWGHTDILAGFFKDASGNPLNVMQRYAATPTYFSVGQAAEMNLGVESFLNMPSSVDGSTVRSRQAAALGAMQVVACGCPEGNATGDCPALNRDIVRSGTAGTGTTDLLACTVTAPATLTLTCGDTQQITATITQGGMSALGEAKWYSLDPTTVTATYVNSNVGSTWGDIHGVKVGTAEVRVYGGGPYGRVQVTVDPPCPPPTP